MGIKKFYNWLTEIQLNVIDKQRKQSISEQVKIRKLLNHLPQYMEATMIPQINEDWTYQYLVQQAESCETSKRHDAVPSTTILAPYQTSSKAYHLDYHRVRNG